MSCLYQIKTTYECWRYFKTRRHGDSCQPSSLNLYRCGVYRDVYHPCYYMLEFDLHFFNKYSLDLTVEERRIDSINNELYEGLWEICK